MLPSDLQARWLRSARVRIGSMPYEKSREPRKRRIVFSIAVSRPRLPAQLVCVSMKLRQMFYTQIERRTFHTTWSFASVRRPARYLRPAPINGHRETLLYRYGLPRRFDDKRRARLNCIAHLLKTIPYKKVSREKIRLPKRSDEGRYNDQAPRGAKIVAEPY